jgi:phosphoglycolate phosphatase-like HAD superfamily hydrolase
MQVHFGDRQHDIAWIAFDKDGTLLEFEGMWGRLAEVWVERLAGQPGQETLRQELFRSLGYDPARQRTEPQSPLAIATTAQVQTIVAVTLYRQGVPWPKAEDRARWAFDTGQELPLASLVKPAGDVVGLLARLQAAEVRVAVVTTDHRADTEETLRLLGVDHLVDELVCGDDGLPSKPAPDMLLAAGRRLGLEPAHGAVVGDTLGDLLMAERAGAGLKVAVLTGAGDPALLAQHADAVLDSIDDIRILTLGAECA